MKVHVLTAADLQWGFDNDGPQYRLSPGAGCFGRQQKVDPHPCYSADRELVERLVAECCERFPLTGAGATGLFILSHEFVGRTNAWTVEDWCYDLPKEKQIDVDGKEQEGHPQAHIIAISGKRIPIMPAMLRYLVPHEYGHAAFHHIAHRIGFDRDTAKLERIYMELRGGSRYEGTYGGGGWHKSASEIIANDFRILVMGREVEFWPHDVPRPTPDSAVAHWWHQAKELIARGE